MSNSLRVRIHHKQEWLSACQVNTPLPDFCSQKLSHKPIPPQLVLSWTHPSTPEDFLQVGRSHTSQNWRVTCLPVKFNFFLDAVPSDPSRCCPVLLPGFYAPWPFPKTNAVSPHPWPCCCLALHQTPVYSVTEA